MRNKKLLSTVVASALAATMAMPVMAADGDTVDVEFTTKTPVIRVAVPTSILAAVDPLEMNTPGTQIHSTAVTLANKSEVPVGIDVKSVVDLGAGVTLADTRAEAMASQAAEAWIAVAAETSNGKYIETANKTAGDLTDTDKNVATFRTEASENSASQTFYLNKASVGNTTYTLIAPVATGGTTAAEYKEQLTYAQVYELTEQTYANEAALLTALKTSDVYEGAGDADNTTLTLIPAGTTSYSAFATSKKYFKAGADNALTSTTAAMTDGKKYVYGEGGEGDTTAFRYIGKLGQRNTPWSDSDINAMHITYDIYGLTDEKYTEAPKEHGLYIDGPQVRMTADGKISVINVDDADYQSMSLNDGSQDWPMGDSDGTWVWNAPASGKKEFTLGDGWMDFFAGKTVTATVTLKDGTEITSAEVTLPAASTP